MEALSSLLRKGTKGAMSPDKFWYMTYENMNFVEELEIIRTCINEILPGIFELSNVDSIVVVEMKAET